MTEIILTTTINAPAALVFDLSRNMDLHQLSTSQTKETAIAGKTSGLIELGESVTWRGRHFGVYLTHQSKITAFDFSNFFVDEMTKGKFRSFRHEHFFEEANGVTTMTDKLQYETPFRILGLLFDWIILKKHLRDLIGKRNLYLKDLAEKQ